MPVCMPYGSMFSYSYLPHRQFRKTVMCAGDGIYGYLPHRQFRNNPVIFISSCCRCLPHRQFRNSPCNTAINPPRCLPHRQFRKLKLCEIWGETNRSAADIGRKWRRIPYCVHDADHSCRRKERDAATSPSNKSHLPLDTVGNVHGFCLL